MSLILNLAKYSEAVTDVPIIKLAEFYDSVFLHIPTDDAKHLELLAIYEIEQDKEPTVVDYAEKLCRDRLTPWLEVNDIDMLNTSAGYHMYQLRFENTATESTESLYLTYNIQTDRPDKTSYVYMERGAELD